MLALIQREPAVFRALVVAVVNVLVVSGVVDTGVAKEVEAAILGALALVAGVGIRNRVTPL